MASSAPARVLAPASTGEAAFVGDDEAPAAKPVADGAEERVDDEPEADGLHSTLSGTSTPEPLHSLVANWTVFSWSSLSQPSARQQAMSLRKSLFLQKQAMSPVLQPPMVVNLETQRACEPPTSVSR